MDREVPEGRGLIHHADRFAPLPPERAGLWSDFCRWQTVYFPQLVGLVHAERPTMFTVSMHVQYLAAVCDEDAVAEAWVEKRGRSLVFSRVEVRTASDVLAATGALVYRVGPAMPG